MQVIQGFQVKLPQCLKIFFQIIGANKIIKLEKLKDMINKISTPIRRMKYYCERHHRKYNSKYNADNNLALEHHPIIGWDNHELVSVTGFEYNLRILIFKVADPIYRTKLMENNAIKLDLFVMQFILKSRSSKGF